MSAAISMPVRPKRRADQRETECRLRELYDWLMRCSESGGLYTGLDMWDKRGRGESGHIILIPEMPRRIMITAMALGMVERIYRDALDLKYTYLRDEQDREVRDFDRSLIVGISEALYRTRVSRGRRYAQKHIREIENA